MNTENTASSLPGNVEDNRPSKAFDLNFSLNLRPLTDSDIADGQRGVVLVIGTADYVHSFALDQATALNLSLMVTYEVQKQLDNLNGPMTADEWAEVAERRQRRSDEAKRDAARELNEKSGGAAK